MVQYKTEYRVNKKGAECFRTDSFEKAKVKYDQLIEKAAHPEIYTIQQRDCRLTRYGCKETDCWGRPAWGPWR